MHGKCLVGHPLRDSHPTRTPAKVSLCLLCVLLGFVFALLICLVACLGLLAGILRRVGLVIVDILCHIGLGSVGIAFVAIGAISVGLLLRLLAVQRLTRLCRLSEWRGQKSSG